MSERNPTLARARRIFDGHAAGHYGLPGDVLAARNAIDALKADRQRTWDAMQEVSPAAARGRAVDAVVLAAREAGTVPDDWAAPLLEAQEAHVTLNLRQQMLEEAISKSENHLVSTLHEAADEVLSEYLRPALAEVMDAVRTILPVADRVPWTEPRRLARVDDLARDAYALVEEQRDRYDAIRAAQEAVRDVTGDPEMDLFRLYGTLANTPDVWPQYGWRVPHNKPPWPEGPINRLSYLVWLATPGTKGKPGAEPWVPTPDEIRHRALAYDTKPINRQAAIHGVSVPTR